MKITILTIFLLIPIFCFTQETNISIVKSEIIKEDKKYIKIILTDKHNDNIIIVREVKSRENAIYPSSYIIEQYNSNLELIDKKALNLDKRKEINGIRLSKNKIEFIVFQKDKLYQFTNVYVLSSNYNKLEFSEKKIFTLNQETHQKYFNERIEPYFLNTRFDLSDKLNLGKIKFSQNKNFMVLTFDLKDQDGDIFKREEHLFFVFDKNNELLFSKKLVLENQDRLINYQDLVVNDDNGELYILSKEYDKNIFSKKRGKTNFKHVLYRIDSDSEEAISMYEEKKFISGLHILREGKNLKLIGFYGEKTASKYKGVCLFSIDNREFTILNKKFSEFSEQFMFDKYGTKKHKDLRSIAFRSVFIDDNGDMVINAEEASFEQYNYNSPYFSSGVSTPTTVNVGGGASIAFSANTQSFGGGRSVPIFNDIVSIKLNKDGDIIWARNINKEQKGITNSSYTSTYFNGKVYFYLNVSDKIKTIKDERFSFKSTSKSNSNLYVITISENGDFDYNKLIDDDDSKLWYQVKNGFVSRDYKSVFIQGTNKKDKQIIKLSVN